MSIVDQSQGQRQLHGFWKIHYLSSIFGLAVISHTNLRSNSTSQSWKSLIGFFLACLPPIIQASFPNIPNTFSIMSWGVGWEQAGHIGFFSQLIEMPRRMQSGRWMPGEHSFDCWIKDWVNIQFLGGIGNWGSRTGRISHFWGVGN